MTGATNRLPFARTLSGLLLLAAAIVPIDAPLEAQTSVQIVSPTAGTVVNPGQTINITVNVTGGQPSSVIVLGDLVGLAQTSSAPYKLQLTVPSSVTKIGPLDISAGAVIGPGNILYSDPVSIDVERPDAPVSISIEGDSLVFDKPGETQSLLVWGKYADGTTANITESSLTTYAIEPSYSPAPVTVSSSGQVTSVAVGSGRVVVNGTYFIPVTVSPPIVVVPNQYQLYAGQQQQFFANVNPALNIGGAVTWSLSPATGDGTIDSTGLFTAAASLTSEQFVQVIVTSDFQTAKNPIKGVRSLYFLSPVMVYPVLLYFRWPVTSGTLSYLGFVSKCSVQNMFGVMWPCRPDAQQVNKIFKISMLGGLPRL